MSSFTWLLLVVILSVSWLHCQASTESGQDAQAPDSDLKCNITSDCLAYLSDSFCTSGQCSCGNGYAVDESKKACVKIGPETTATGTETRFERFLGMELHVAVVVLIFGSALCFVLPLVVLLCMCGYCVCVQRKVAIAKRSNSLRIKSTKTFVISKSTLIVKDDTKRVVPKSTIGNTKTQILKSLAAKKAQV